MSTNGNTTIAPADGKLGILIPGMGAVSTTFMAGIEAIKRGLGQPIGSLTQLGTVRLGKRTDARTPKIQDFVPLARMEDLVFGGWDIFEDNAYESAVHASVLEASLLEKIRAPLEAIKPMKAVFDTDYVRRLQGPNVKDRGSKMDKAEMLMEDIRQFRESSGASRLVMIWCGSTEVFHKPSAVHQTLKDFECGLQKDDADIAPSQIYAYAALKSGVPYANGAPNLTTDTPALLELARERQIPVCGKDFKTGQTFMKTLIAPGTKGAHAGNGGLVFHQHSWESRWRGAGRSGLVQIQRRNQAVGAGADPAAARFTRCSTRISITPCASITIRRAAMPKKAGTTSTSSDGWAIRCRSRSISCAGIRSWRRPWCWIWFCSWIWRSAPE